MIRRPDESSLFLVRVWAKERDREELGWCGKVQHVVSGEACPFCDWSELQAVMLKMLTARSESELDEGGKIHS